MKARRSAVAGLPWRVLESTDMALRLEQVSAAQESGHPGDNVYNIYLKEALSIPLLDEEQTLRLTTDIHECRRRLKADEKQPRLTDKQRSELKQRLLQAVEQIVKANQRLVIKFARPFIEQARHLDPLDIIQEGNLGLLRAIEKFRLEKGFKLSTYAVIWIKRSISGAIINTDRMIRVPKKHQEDKRSHDRSRHQLSEIPGRQLNDEELAARLGIDIADIKDLVSIDNLSRSLKSLDKEIKPGGETSLLELIADPHAASPEETALETINKEEMRAVMGKLIGQLEPVEQEIMRRRFGFADEPLTLTDISRELGLTLNVTQRAYQLAISKLLRLFHGQPATGGRLPTLTDAESRDMLPAVLEFDYEDRPTVMEVALGKLVVRLAEKEQPPSDTDWLLRGNCLPFNLDIFHPPSGQSPAASRVICSECPVKTPCLEYALARKHLGTWGATTNTDRRIINNQRRQLQALQSNGQAEAHN